MTYFPTSILTLFNYSQDFLPLLVETFKNDGLKKFPHRAVENLSDSVAFILLL